MATDRERLVTLLRTMRRLTDEVGPYIAALPEWDECTAVLDLAGGHGELLAAIAGGRPRLRGTVLDQPHAEQEARATFERRGLAGRLDFVARDLTAADALAGLSADGVLLARCLHNFGEEQIRGILRAARDALLPGGRLVVVENYLHQEEGTMEPRESAVFSAYMAVNCAGGHVPPTEWMVEEFRALGSEPRVERFAPAFVSFVARW